MEPYVRDWDYEVSPSTLLIYAMEDAKLNMINPEYREAFIKTFQLKADYDEDFIILDIPVDRILFEEREGRLHSDLDVKITVYRDHKKIDSITLKKTCSFSESEILAVNEISVKIPYRAKKKGYYLFDLVITDLNSLYEAKYRAVIKRDLTGHEIFSQPYRSLY